MTIFDQLKQSIKKAQDEEEFPDYLARRCFLILDNQEAYINGVDKLEKLIEMIDDYNTYAETCCEKIGFSPNDVDMMLDKILGKSE